MRHHQRNIIVLCATVFLSSVSWNQVVPFLPKFLEDIGGKQNLYLWIGLVTAVQSLSGILAMPFWGKLGDKYGRKPMIVRAGICLVGIYLGMSICRAPWHLVVFRFLNGALTGFIPGSFALVATNTPEELAPNYIATLQVASSLGLIMGPVVGGVLAEMFGFRASMQVSAAAVLLCTLAVVLFVREPNKTKAADNTSLLQDMAIALRSRVQMSIMIGVMMVWFFGAAVSPYLVLYVESLYGKLSSAFAGGVFALPAVAFVATAHMWASVGTARGFHRTIIMGATGTAICMVVVAFIPNIYGFAALYLLAGVWLAAISPSTGALTCTRVEETFRGRAYGIQNSMGAAAAFFAPFLASSVAALFGMRWVFVMVGVVFFAGILVFRRLVAGWDVENDKPRRDETAITA